MKAACLVIFLVSFAIPAIAQTNNKTAPNLSESINSNKDLYQTNTLSQKNLFGKITSPLGKMPENYFKDQLDSLSRSRRNDLTWKSQPRFDNPQFRSRLLPLAKPGDHKFELLPSTIPGGVIIKFVK